MNQDSRNSQLRLWWLKLLSIFSIFIWMTMATYGQKLNHVWSHSIGNGGGDRDECQAMTTDDDGNLYAAGTFFGANDFDPDTTNVWLSSSLNDDGYFAKYDSTGRPLWVKRIETKGDIAIKQIEVDRSGNVLIVGLYQTRIDFDPSKDTSYAYSNVGNPSNGFVAKYSNKGDLIWGLNLGGVGYDFVTSVAIDDSNNVVIGGQFADTVDFNPGAGVNLLYGQSKNSNAFLAKYDSLGKHIWSFALNSSFSSYTTEVRIDANSNILATGHFSDTADFDPSASSANLMAYGGTDVFLAKYRPNGQYIWAKQIGGSSSESAYSMALSTKGNVFLTGSFRDTADFDPSSGSATLTSYYQNDLFLAKYSSNGQYLWAEHLGDSNGYIIASEIALDTNENFYITGFIGGSIDFDPSSSSNVLLGLTDGYVAKYDSSGNFNWAFLIGGNGSDRGHTITADNFGYVWAGGLFSGEVDFNPGIGIAKLNSKVNYARQASYFARYEQSKGTYKAAWSTTDRKGGPEAILGLVHDSKGNIYTTGYYYGKVDFDPACNVNMLNGKVMYTSFVAKYDTLGRLQWAHKLGDSTWVITTDIACDSSDNIYVLGRFGDQLDLDPSSKSYMISSKGYEDAFLAKYNSNGQFLWGHGYGGSYIDQVGQLSIDSAQNVWITGTFYDTVDFDPGIGTTTLIAKARDIYFAKYDENGNFQFAKAIGGNGLNFSHSLINGSNNCVYLVGRFADTCDFDPGSAKANLISTRLRWPDPFMAKYDSLGRYIWAKQFNGSSHIGRIRIDKKENIYIAGSLRSSMDFDLSTGVKTVRAKAWSDAFVASYDSSINLRWTHNFGGKTGDNGVWDIEVNDQHVNATGSFCWSVDFNPSSSADSILVSAGNPSNNTVNPFILQLDTNGVFVSAASIKADYGAGACLSIDRKKMVVSGTFAGGADLDISSATKRTVSTYGIGGDIFLAQYGYVNPCKPTSSVLIRNICGPFVAPSGCKVYHQSGTYTDTVMNVAGCDSIITINLTIRNTFSTISTSVCDSFKAPSGKIFRVTGVHSDTIANAGGCDSIITIDLRIKKKVKITKVVACDSFFSASHNRYFTQSGNYYDTLTGANNCDSIVVLKLTVNKSSSGNLAVTSCDSFTAPSGRHTHYKSGTYFDTLSTLNGCDSVLRISLVINQTKSRKIKVTACDTFVSPGNRHSYTTSGTYYDTLATSSGCDSVLEMEVIIKNTTFNYLQTLACDSLVSPSGKYTIYKSGVYRDTLMNQAGCDSIMVMTVDIHHPTVSTLSINSCDSFLSPSGKHLYTNSGTYHDTILNANGCDSIITLNLIISNTLVSKIAPSACGSFISPSGKYVWNQSGLYFDTLSTVSGCDSIVEIQLIVLPKSFNTLALSHCDSVISPNGRHVYKNTGQYRDTLISANGCDSILTLDVTIYRSRNSVISKVACDSYTLPSGKRTVTQSGTYYDTIQTTMGCDSVLKIQVTIETLKAKVYLDTVKSRFYTLSTGVSRQWLECLSNNTYKAVPNATDSIFTPTTTGKYAVQLKGLVCTDTSTCQNILVTNRREAEAFTWKVYPNPTSGQILVETSVAFNGTLQILNPSGEVVGERTFSGKQLNLNLADLAKGIYYLRLKGEDFSEVRKVVKF